MNGYVYVIVDNVNQRFKIGSAKYPSQRLKQLQTGNPNKLSIALRIPSTNMEQLEDELQAQYKHRKIRGEWYKLTWEDFFEIQAIHC
jgi:hypothetical protein